MKEYKIIDYETRYKDALIRFIKSAHPDYSDVYIDFCVNKAEGHFKSTIVIDDNNNIVGVHLWFNTTIKVNGTVLPTAWGHDTFLNIEDRKYIGLDFILTIRNPYAMGIGLTDINEKIQKKSKAPLLENYYNIFCFSIWTPFLFLLNHSKKNRPLKVEDIRANGYTFGLTKSVNEISFINGGFWYKDYVDADLYRGEDFLKMRFFENNVFDYYVYTEKSNKVPCYFVVRPICYKRIPALLLVDFRYDISKPYLLESILKAVKAIAFYNNLGLIMTTIGDKNALKFYDNIFTLKRKTSIVYGKKLRLNSTSTMPITPADADIDYHR